jgi:hypothetical protein
VLKPHPYIAAYFYVGMLGIRTARTHSISPLTGIMSPQGYFDMQSLILTFDFIQASIFNACHAAQHRKTIYGHLRYKMTKGKPQRGENLMLTFDILLMHNAPA